MQVRHDGDITDPALVRLLSECHLIGATQFHSLLGAYRHSLDIPTFTRRAFRDRFAPYHENEAAKRYDLQYR